MSPPPAPSQAFPLTTPRQEQIFRRLRDQVSDGAAAFYLDACRLLVMRPPLATLTHLVGHALREVDSAVHDVLLPIGYEAPDTQKHRAEIFAIARALGLSQELRSAWLKTSVGYEETGLHRQAHRDDLNLPRTRDVGFDFFVEDVEGVLDAVLAVAEQRYISIIDHLDHLLTQPRPTRADVLWLKSHVPSNDNTLGYFFRRLSHPQWLPALKAHGVFKRPPETVENPATGERHYLRWPHGEYLVRMAAIPSMQQQVATIAQQVGDSTNPWVQGHVSAIMKALPVPLVIALLPAKIRWLEAGGAALQEDEYLAETALRLSREGFLAEAWRLFAALLSSLARSEGGMHLRMQVIRDVAPTLLDHTGIEGLTHLCDLLQADIEGSPEAQRAPQDLSYIWRPAIEDHPQNGGHFSPRDAIVVTIRDGALRLVQDGRVPLHEILHALQMRTWLIFSRIAYYVLRVTAHPDPALLSTWLVDRTRLEETGSWHEYGLLLREQFAALSGDDQAKILGWLATGPSQRVSPDPERDVALWQWVRLAVLHSALPQEWRERYAALVARFDGEPEHPEFPAAVITIGSPPGQVEVEAQLKGLSVREVILFLAAWQPPSSPFSFSQDGLGLLVERRVQQQALAFSHEASQFAGLPMAYLAGLFRGLEAALRNTQTLAWPPLLELCDRILTAMERRTSRAGASEEGKEESEVEYHRARNLCITLLNTVTVGLAADDAAIPFSERRRVWRILRRLVKHHDPTGDDEAVVQGSEPASRALNTVRGMAMRAVVIYALWVRRHVAGRTFRAMPEVRAVLDGHVNLARDPAVAVHVLFGQFLPKLLFLDASWTATHVEPIFPREPERALIRHATWDTYVTFNPAYRETLALLRDDYRWAIDAMGIGQAEERVGRRFSASQEISLSEHLMHGVTMGALSLHPVDELLVTFFSRAPDPVRAHAIEWVGRWLFRASEEISPAVGERLQCLWESRRAALGEEHIGKQETVAFGWWFGSGKLEPTWARAQLDWVLSQTNARNARLDADYLVVEQLARQVSEAPRSVISLLHGILALPESIRRVEMWQDDHVRAILAGALYSEDGQASQEAMAILSLLAAHGHFSYRSVVVDAPQRRAASMQTSVEVGGGA
jgi:hypothetical protein